MRTQTIQANIEWAREALARVTAPEPTPPASKKQEVITEPPGVRVICSAVNAQDGRDHYQRGMFRTLRIVE